MKNFNLEFTANDRITFEVKMVDTTITGLRVKYEGYQKTGKVVTDIKGFEPFPEGEWVTIIRYDNFKGDALKDIQKPTPVTFSPFGFHMKDNWGRLDTLTFFNKIEKSVKTEWLSSRNNYGANLVSPPDEIVVIANKNIPRCFNLAKYFLENLEILLKVRENQTFIPVPKEGEDEYLLEQNSLFANRLDKKALRGDVNLIEIGQHRVLTYVPRG